MFIFVQNPFGTLELEGGDTLLLENGNGLDLEPTEDSFVVQVIDENPVLAIPYYWLHPFFSFQAEPGTFFEIVWFPGTGQQEQEVLMPTYDQRYLSGDISSMPYFELQLFDSIHFGPDQTGDFAGPITVDIVEGPSDVELRTPE